MSIATPPETVSRFVVSRQPKPVVATIPSTSGFPARLLLAVFLIFYFPAFTFQLAMDPITGRWTGSPILQFITISSELFVFVVILASRNIRNLVFQCWPICALVAVAFISVTWSRNLTATIQSSNTYMTTALFGLVIVGVLPQFQCIRFVIRVMALGCLLSVLWVFLFPEVAVHQLTDPYQTVHAGLWRGVFSHKQGLGYFSGLTIGLLLFYRTSIFSTPLLALFVACSFACLIGTRSATGIVAAVITLALLHMAYFVTRFPIRFRKAIFVKFAIGLAAIGIGFKLGILNYVIVQILGKSTDLSGRADFWPIMLQNFYNSGKSLLGGGFGAGLGAELSEWSIDNGYLEKFVEFGYAFSPVVFGIFALILWGGVRLILTTPTENARTNIFPFAIWLVILIVNIVEANFMTKCLSTVLTSMAVGLIFQPHRSHRSMPSPGKRRQVELK